MAAIAVPAEAANDMIGTVDGTPTDDDNDSSKEGIANVVDMMIVVLLEELKLNNNTNPNNPEQ